MKIQSLHISNMLSFSEEHPLDVTFDKYNLIIGPNNEGKSNVLKSLLFIHYILFSAEWNNREHFTHVIGIDDIKTKLSFIRKIEDLFYMQKIPKELYISFALVFTKEEADEIKTILPFFNAGQRQIKIIPTLWEESEREEKSLKFKFKIKEIHQMELQAELIGLSIPDSENGREYTLFDIEENLVISVHESRGIISAMDPVSRHVPEGIAVKARSMFGDVGIVLKRVLRSISSNRLTTIQPLRGIYPLLFEKRHNELKDDLEGRIVQRLMNLRDGRIAERKKFLQVKQMLRELLFPSIPENQIDRLELIFPDINESTQYAIELSLDDKILPLSQLGAGLEQLIYMSLEIILSTENSLILIEEPESHFHPKLQRAFIRFLMDQSKKYGYQFFITTHSNTFIDPLLKIRTSTKIIKVSMDAKETFSRVENIFNDNGDCNSMSDLCRELGIFASDLLQSNGIIWVEGPSDRIYLLKWLNLFQALNENITKVVEGRDFSILFYGGKVLSNFDLDQDWIDEVEEANQDFISMLHINRNAVVLMDRDSETDNMWSTKIKIEAEANKGHGFGWITDGTEIENYLTRDCLVRAYKDDIVPDTYEMNKRGQPFEKSLDEKYQDRYTKAKKRFALKVTKNMVIQDLKDNQVLISMIEKLHMQIVHWNDIQDLTRSHETD